MSMSIVYLRLFLRLLLGLILFTSGSSKLSHYHRFQSVIQDYEVIPRNLEAWLRLSKLLTVSIPLMEVIAGLGLVSGWLLLPSVVIASALLLIFCSVMIINLLRGRTDLSCHCGGVVSDHIISWWLIGRNVLFLVGLFVLLVTPPDIYTIVSFVRNPSLLSSAFMSIIVPVTVLVGVVLAALMLFNTARAMWRS